MSFEPTKGKIVLIIKDGIPGQLGIVKDVSSNPRKVTFSDREIALNQIDGSWRAEGGLTPLGDVLLEDGSPYLAEEQSIILQGPVIGKKEVTVKNRPDGNDLIGFTDGSHIVLTRYGWQLKGAGVTQDIVTLSLP
ncbi:MAG: hypothetical protein WC505_07425 [Patescibacteria group bacterium]